MITIDGSMGEGGGQLLRSSLALSLLTSTPLRITKIRAGRARPGLMRQHLMAVHAATTISDAEVSGTELGSTELVFRPKAIRSGDYRFAISGAGSSTLVFQTILLPLLLGSSAPSTLYFEGGTHNPLAPPFDFLQRVYLPLLARMGARVEVELTRYGFYPAGGGAWSATVYPTRGLERLELLERGAIVATSASALVASVAPSVALRELDALAAALAWPREACRPLMIADSRGPGNVLMATVQSDHVTELVTGFGARGVPAERVAAEVAAEIGRYLAADVPVGEHLADQLLLPLALGSGGCFRTLEPSRHCTTQLELLQLFVGAAGRATRESEHVWRIELGEAGGSA